MRWKFLLLMCLCHAATHAADAPHRTPVALRPDDVIATGNEWLARPDICAADGARTTFNALSMRDRGLLQVAGEDPLLLQRSHERALGILLTNPWDGGNISEGIDPHTARMDRAGRAFATAAGYVAHAICATACIKQ
ncbi:MAG TPA: hypothetical protein VK505_00010 [Steroidobacteraceae bacterium]|nr:hypothetical protein [Steroidobacteraceae bacterium]